VNVLETADRLWRGESDTSTHHPFFVGAEGAEIADDVFFVASFANASVFATDDGLVVIDTGSAPLAGLVHDRVRAWSSAPLHTAVFTHGHIDHVFGVDLYEADATAMGASRPRVLAHEGVPRRFDRYRLTAGYNEIVNQRQFRLPNLRWPVEYRYPDETYATALDVTVGGVEFRLRHARGETDDHTWTWIPSRGVLCTGDLFIWASPNCGNPQKVQRYPKDWAVALREMATLDAEVLLPGHGLPIIGATRVRTALTESAALLEFLHDETVAMMNAGARLDEILHTVHAPPELLARPYLRPVYDEPEFVVRNVWRLYGGWYDGNPAHLKPATERALATEIAALAGGADRLARRAGQLAAAGDDASLRLAGHLAEYAALAAPDDATVRAAHADVFERRVAAATSTMAKGVFGWAAAQSRERSGSD